MAESQNVVANKKEMNELDWLEVYNAITALRESVLECLTLRRQLTLDNRRKEVSMSRRLSLIRSTGERVRKGKTLVCHTQPYFHFIST